MGKLPTTQWNSIFEGMVHQIDEGILIVDAKQKDMPIIFANKGFYNITGYRPKEVIGNNPRFLKGPETNKKAENLISNCIKHKRNGSITLLNYKADGTTFWNNFSISPIKDSLGKVTHWIGVQRDITELIRIIKGESNDRSMNVTIRTISDILNNFLNSLLFFRQHLADCPHLENKILVEFDDAYGVFKNKFIQLCKIEKYKEKKLDNNFSVLDFK